MVTFVVDMAYIVSRSNHVFIAPDSHEMFPARSVLRTLPRRKPSKSSIQNARYTPLFYHSFFPLQDYCYIAPDIAISHVPYNLHMQCVWDLRCLLLRVGFPPQMRRR